MSKQCLCYRPADGAGPYIENWNTFLMDRAVVDDPEKLDPAIQQILPYVTIYRAATRLVNGVETDSLELLTYSRGGKTTEQRLTAKRSVGFGGHIDSLPGDSILQHIYEEAHRELVEEIGFKVNPSRLHAAILRTARSFNFITVQDRAPVDSVHTALCLLLDIAEHPDNDNFVLEAGHIEDLRWIGVEDLSEDELRSSYETWSEIVVLGLRKNLVEFRKAQVQQAEMQAWQAEQERKQEQLHAINRAAQEAGDGTLVLPITPLQKGQARSFEYDHALLKPEVLEGDTGLRLHPQAKSASDAPATPFTTVLGEDQVTYIVHLVPFSPEEPARRRLVLADILNEKVELRKLDDSTTDGVTEAEAQA